MHVGGGHVRVRLMCTDASGKYVHAPRLLLVPRSHALTLLRNILQDSMATTCTLSCPTGVGECGEILSLQLSAALHPPAAGAAAAVNSSNNS